MANHQEDNLEIVKKNIKSFPNFPKDGVNFKDIFAVLRNPKSLKAFIQLIKEKARYYSYFEFTAIWN
jgi:adenine/guanine phosphoribosyltransferase-like PRPP-binding protein